MVFGKEVEKQFPPLYDFTVYVPAVVTVMDLVVAPVDHNHPPVTSDEVSVMDCPFTNTFVEGLEVIVGTVGGVQVVEVTVFAAEVALHPFDPVIVTR